MLESVDPHFLAVFFLKCTFLNYRKKKKKISLYLAASECRMPNSQMQTTITFIPHDIAETQVVSLYLWSCLES